MTIEDLQETARLARLSMDDDALAAAFPAFERMLGFFAVMQEADRDAAAFPDFSLETAGFRDSERVPSDYFREDGDGALFAPASLASLQEAMLDNAGARDGGFVVIPNVL
ncbi:MAG: aspartyl/glutamyl-tRNA amidotransferase subunit C [Spirochaetaceae bacterium]|jgi:aspartyl-tRNA(Asn)/glutamyl-tRNA(Gln) amidotransferase subunit C|nr:aspartyl/glutamyl-tRNA amidotransferase subunit C [Spirochaetaceae bacterium]